MQRNVALCVCEGEWALLLWGRPFSLLFVICYQLLYFLSSILIFLSFCSFLFPYSSYFHLHIFRIIFPRPLGFLSSFVFASSTWRPPLWSSGQNFWLQIQRSRVRFPALPDFLSSSGSGTGSTQPREVN